MLYDLPNLSPHFYKKKPLGYHSKKTEKFSTSAVIFLKLSASCTSRFDALYFMWSADSSFSFRKTPEKQPPKKIRQLT